MFKMAPENLDVSGFFSKHEWKLMPEEIRHGAKCMYFVYKQGKIDKPDFVTRYEEFRADLEGKEQAAKQKTPAFRIQQQKARMRKKLKNKKEDGVEECLKGFSQLEIDESARKKKLMDEVVRALEKEMDTGPDSEPVYIKKRRLRRLKKVNYMEVPEQEDDAYTWCDECDKRFLKFCPLHGPLVVVPDDKTGDMELGCPPLVALRPSGIPGAGRGAWAAEALPSGVRFGPYRGQVSSRPNPNSQYVWQVRRPNQGREYVDGEKLANANWLRFVNCSRNPREQNLAAYQYKGKIYYRTVKNIYPNTELLVWYGPQYGKLLNIDPKQYHAPAPLRTPLQGGGLQREEGLAAGPQHGGAFTCRTVPQPSTSKGRFPCQLSGKSSTFPLQGEKTFKCDACEYSCKRAGHLKQHQLVHTGEKPFTCNACEYSCTTAGSLKRHQRVHTGEKPFTCDACEYSCTQAGSLKLHQRVHTGEKPFTCDACEYSCTTAGSLKLHQRVHTGEKPFTCDACEYSCTSSGNLKQHQRVHTGEKPFTCDGCEYSCTTAGSLKLHQRVHTGEKPFTCDACEYSCTSSGNLKQHQRVHTGEKPFTCDGCEYSCTTAGSLKLHQRVHTGEKPFTCDACEYSCTSSGNLKQHQRVHTGEKPFTCDGCEYSCTTSGSLKRHQRCFHTK